jgi:hypothetical protein
VAVVRVSESAELADSRRQSLYHFIHSRAVRVSRDAYNELRVPPEE